MTPSLKALVVAGLVSGALSATAAVSISEDFEAATVNSALTVPAGWSVTGVASKTGDGRNFIATVDTDYLNVDFTLTVDYSLAGGGGPGIAFFGIGSAAPNASWYNTPGDAFWAESRPGDFDAGDVQWSTMIGAGTNPPEVTFGTAGDGAHRFSIVKLGDNITLSVDIGADGTYDGSVTQSLANDLSFLNDTNARLFIGTEGANATFDNLSIIVVPEPGETAIAGMALVCVLCRRRKYMCKS